MWVDHSPQRLVGLLLAAASLAALPIAATSVNVALQASFGAPPYLLELLETAAQENASSYFPLLDRIADGHFADHATDKELFDAFLETLRADGHVTSAEDLASFRLALSIHSAAPRVEAHYQYYKTSVESLLVVAQDAACPVWVHLEGKQYCTAALERAQQDFKGPANSGNLPFDRVVNFDSELPVSTLYADINNPLFPLFHRALRERARAGRTSYRLRYRPSSALGGKPLSVSGYGVELALKRTDYIVVDDRKTGGEENSGKAANVEDLSFKTEEMDDLKPLSSSELLGLGLKTSSYIMGHANPLDALEKITQDFPKHSSAISKLDYSAEFFHEHRSNRDLYLSAGYNVIWINGLQVDPRQMDAFAFLDKLRYERKLIGSLREVGFTSLEAISLISHVAVAQVKNSEEVPRYDYRDALEGGNVIVWLNNLEKDKRYADWPTHTSTLLQRMYPGQLPAVRRDIHNVVVPLDLTNSKSIELAAETMRMLVKRNIPIRFGFVPLALSAESEKQAKTVYYLQESYGLSAVIDYLSAYLADKKDIRFNQARFDAATKDRKVRKNGVTMSPSTIFEAEAYNTRVSATKQYLRRLGADHPSAPAFVNGVAVPNNDALLQSMSERIGVDLNGLQKQIFEGSVEEEAWLADLYLKSAATSRNALIIPEDESAVILLDIGKIIKEHETLFAKLPTVMPSDDALKQFWSYSVLVTDLDSEHGASLLAEMVEFRKQQSEAQIVIIHNPANPDVVNFKSAKLFDVLSRKKELNVADIEWVLDPEAKPRNVDPEQSHEMADTFWSRMLPLISSLGFAPGQSGVILNGRKVGPIPTEVTFNSGDFAQLLAYERTKRITPANTAVTSLNLEDKIGSALAAARVSSLVALSSISDIPEGIFDTASNVRMNAFQSWKNEYSAISVGNLERASIQIVASVDPTSETAQRWVPILRTLSELSGVHLKLFLNPRERMQELPVKRFYRHVLSSKPNFDEEGAAVALSATFEGLPKEALLNLALDVPPAWLVSPKSSIYDLDNIKLSAIKSGANVDAVYELEHILIEGHSRDMTTGQPPRGTQLLLGTESNHHFADTLIMANLGYFQFKANPGFWNIRLKPGRSEQILKIDSIGVDGYSEKPGDSTTEVTLMSFQGKTLYPRLSRKPGQETEDVLEDGHRAGSPADYVAKASRFASGILSNVGLAAKPEHADINVFSVASGHLYERMLNIMMVSVMRHTRRSVKFWFVEQFLSPSFKQSLPHLAAAYGFSYETVTYKWPHWLRGQREKQREIWGYKILFLDVLFPLSLDKVIFVDADQVVRTDLHSLATHDLQGAPYGFAPMCDSRAEMEGYRFWKQGYWRGALRGRPYHISALYAVDLRRFRALAAGDRLRQSYHQLSADPASLANLDQDLPNNMQAALPIHTLPQEWLWCETWCDDESLKAARTIDLCNNPETKEPKLQRARRLLPEWTVYDEEIAEVLRKAKEDEGGVEDGGRAESVQERLDSEGGRKDEIKDEL